MPRSLPSLPIGNNLLASLPADIRARVLPKLTAVSLNLRQVLCVPETPIETVYFPLSGMISLVATLDGGEQVEVGIVGREGMFGISLLYGVGSSFVEAMVQMPGTALRISARAFRDEIDTNREFRAHLLLYGEAFQAQVSQTAACNGRHGLEQRLARWLLMAHDRAGSDELPLTQDFIAVMLGVHRPSITVIAGILQRAGLIRYAAGVITILDRRSLEAAACECYATVRRRHEALLGTNSANGM